LGVILAALCIYAAGIWTVGHLARKFWNALKRLGHKHDNT
jgi:Na+-transporting methylmalonyl-CoA/oxaloacetate decarboxylase gamma subunit